MTKILTPKIFIVFVVSFQVELTGEWDYNDETFHCSAAQPETSCLPATFGFSDDCEDLMAELFAPWEPVSPVASTSGFQTVAKSPKSPGQKRKEKKGKKRMFILPKHKTRLIENLTALSIFIGVIQIGEMALMNSKRFLLNTETLLKVVTTCDFLVFVCIY